MITASAIADPQSFLKALFDAAVARAQPARCLPPFLPAPPKRGRTIVLGAGKAAAAMADAFEAAAATSWPLDAVAQITGCVVTKRVHMPLAKTAHRGPSGIMRCEAAHPVPDAAGVDAAARIAGLAREATADDLVVFLLSGGASALLTLPAPGITLAQQQAITAALLRSGAAIGEINTVRKHLSAIKAGRLAALAAPARLVTLAISDVPGDDPAVIGSGPTVGDPSAPDDARAILERLAIPLAPAIERALMNPANRPPAPDDPLFANHSYHLIARPRDSLEAAAALARQHGVEPVTLGDAIEGEARDVARAHAADAIARAKTRPRPLVMLSGGEVTVTGAGSAPGGPNREYALALALALNAAPEIYALAADTDGGDGSGEAAGARVTPDTLARATSAGLDAKAALDAHASGAFFDAIGDSLVTGPTHTNVNDFRALLIR